jgi:mannose/cellobiose epimerase-like protein (N-acyl-D-glucosamine 2-epimerase family)/glycosyltransferase involved in cell wall biosynthesis
MSHYAGERPMGIGSHLSAWSFAFTSPRNDLFSRTNSDAASAKGLRGMSDLAGEAAALRRWLFDVALPLWWEVGADRINGGFHEAIDLDGRPLARPRRARSIARQAFAYGEAGRLSWNGPWRNAARHALDFFARYFISADGTVASVVDLDGKVLDAKFDLYDQAFALLAFASGHRSFGAATPWRRHAVALRAALERDVAHAQGGFREDRAGSLPQRANPHMHLFEAALAWMELDADPGWRGMADGIAALCLDKFIDPASGALRENFAADWSPAPGIAGRVCEPGHHYEWAFLLNRWSELSGRPRPVAVARLIAFANDHGVDVQRGVAVGAVLSDGALHDPVARLWAQAERIRAYAIDRQPGDAERIAAAIRGLRRFLATPTPGLWYDRLDGDDRLISEPARATSLYHIIGAVAELEKLQLAASAATRTKPGAGHLRPPRLVYLVTEDWYFISHRLPMARAARDAGYEVHVATHVDRHRAAIEAEGFFLHPLDWRRGSFDPRDLSRVIGEIRRLYRRLQPDLAHHVAVQAALVGSLAAIGLPVVCLNAATGLGTSFLGNSAKARIASPVAAVLMRALLNRSRSAVLVQNSDDRAEIERLGVEAGRIALIPGSGVDTDVLKPAPEPAGPITIAFAGRLVEDKGIRTLIAAHDLLTSRGHDIRLLIAGLPDAANPTSIPLAEIKAWSNRPNLKHLGFVEDIAAFWASAHIAVLPSRREGLPLTLLEAAACGRPLVATDVPGCREIARAGVNALLVPADDAQVLADAIGLLAADRALRARFGAAGRALVEREFSSAQIGRAVVDLYRRLLEGGGAAGPLRAPRRTR